MTPAPLRALAVALIAAAAIAVAVMSRAPAGPPPRPAGQRPTLLLLTSLPLVLPEQFTLKGSGSPALKALETRYRVLPISVTEPAELGKGRILLMAHPLAQPAEDLVALDQWVRGGGRVLVLADPRLEWPSSRPIGDPLRPPPMFMDTGLLAHWGLRLDAPDQPGPKTLQLGGYDVGTASPGELSGNCPISKDRLVAHCRIGRGRATIIADADLLNADAVEGAKHNLDALLAELAGLEQR